MKRIKQIILILLLGLFINSFFTLVKADNNINIYFFHSEFCLHCQEMDDYLDDLVEDYDNITVHYFEVGNPDNMDLLNEVADIYNQSATVPFVAIGGLAFSGYNDQIKYDMDETIQKYTDSDFVDITNKVINNEEVLITDLDTLEREVVILPIIGEIQIESLSLFVSAVVLGFVDGFNPCAMWVLIFLIGMLVNMNNRKKMWLIGLTFLITSAFVYFLIMVSWLQIAVSLTAVKWIRYLIGAFALIFGGYNISKFIKASKREDGCEVVSDNRRTKIIEKVKNIIKNKNLLLALLGVIALAATVNLIELACSAGLPLLFTQILAYNDLSTGMYLFYIIIYILLFLIDDIIIFSVAMITLRVTGISNKYTKYSTIIGGIIMLIIGVLLLFFPNIIMFNF